MFARLFNALGVSSINSQTFAGGYYYEYSLEIINGAWNVTRKLHNRYDASSVAESEVVTTPEQIEACKQALMYNFPHAFNIDGSVAIELPELPEPTTPETDDTEHMGEADAVPDASAETGAGDEAEAEQEVGGVEQNETGTQATEYID